MSDSQVDAAKRPWLAAALAVIVPGLGHVYLRLWRRAVVWFTLYLVTTQFLVPEDATPDSFSIEAFSAAAEAAPLSVMLLVVSISALNVADAYFSARSNTAEDDSAPTCPNCGKELDGDLEFCHWCTTPLDGAETEEN